MMPAYRSIPTGGLKFQVLDNHNVAKSAGPGGQGRADPKLRKACIEMESLFIDYLLKEMRATVDKSGFISGGKTEELYTAMLDTELAKKISYEGGIGLAAILMRQLGPPAK